MLPTGEWSVASAALSGPRSSNPAKLSHTARWSPSSPSVPTSKPANTTFKHYTRTIRVDPASNCQSGTLACPFRTFAGAYALAWPGAEIRLRAGTYIERPIISTRVRITAEGGTVRIGG